MELAVHRAGNVFAFVQYTRNADSRSLGFFFLLNLFSVVFMENLGKSVVVGLHIFQRAGLAVRVQTAPELGAFKYAYSTASDGYKEAGIALLLGFVAFSAYAYSVSEPK